ncbi:hypothetical protein [Actinomyces sp. MRS3W]|uniref:restriction system modified-DNA reader domain-containing protein n=1 Tax=Actinomyces sp. MRS3W TaxID=2800796 RepID=UPI0028FD3A23|nr:hypothetical protein [Actinomyces sp. MRS3W]MDU0347547.1 hypothetical protein [Actinomyces sp. MRS3W]
MALFDLNDNRLEPAVLGRPATDADRTAVLAAVRRQIAEVLRRPLLGICWDQVIGGDALTALDAAGQVVTIEVIDVLDSTALLMAMARATNAARAGRDQLASRYPGGLLAFEQDWNGFRDSVPAGVDPGPRLTLVVTEIADDVRTAFGMIADSGVEVHELRVRSTEDGRALVSVELLRTDVASEALDADRFTAPAAADPADDPRPDDATAPTPVVAQPPNSTSSAPTPSESSGSVSGHRLDAAVLGAEPTVPAGETSERALSTLAETIDTPATLVWVRRRRGINHEATLAGDGTITLADGTSYRDPSAAANAAQHTQDVDGWRAWRVGASGPSLRELLEPADDEASAAERG